MAQLAIQQAFNLALQHHQAGRLYEAEQLYRQILAQQPEHTEAMHHLGIIAHQAGRIDVAVDLIRRAIALNPNYAEACNNLGNVLRDKGELDDAIAACRRAVALRPNYAQAHNNLGNALKDKGQLDDAIAACRQALTLHPNLAEAYNNLGNALRGNGQLDEAISAHGRAIAINPNFAQAHSNLVLTLHYHWAYDAQAIAAEYRRWNRQHAARLSPPVPGHSNDRSPDRRLRVGYLSADLRDHVVGQNLLPLFRQHDHQQFEIICYAQVPCPDGMTRQLQQHADCWRSIVGLSDEQVAKQIREDGIDLLVDLALHTANNRLLVLARKPAPVQLTYLGYCGSTGMSAMDYRLSDPYLDPPGTDLSCYTEKTLHLPRTYWCYQPGLAPALSPAPALRNGVVTFGCLNNFAKVSRATLDLWARILLAVANSRVIIHAPPGKSLDDVAQRLADAGVPRNRLTFVGMQPWAKYMETYSQIDVALDPFPYGGGITTCDALWMGVPVVSLSGQTAVGRSGRSILSNLGVAELVAFTPDEYVRIAIDLAQDPNRLDSLRRGMRDRMLASPLMDAGGFARDVEAAYRQIWREWCDTASVRS